MTVLVLLLKAYNNYLIKWHLDVWLEDVGSEAPGKTESLLCYHMPSSDSRAISPIASTPRCPLLLPSPPLSVPPQSKSKHALRSQSNKLIHPQYEQLMKFNVIFPKGLYIRTNKQSIKVT